LEYANSNDVIKEVSCPRIFGWKFSNIEKESGILTNITDSTYSISVDNAYSSELLWTHWTATDTLRAYINGYDSIERNYQTGTTNISIPPFSLNTCITVIKGDINQDEILNVMDIIMVVNCIINENTISNKQFVISDLNLDEIINVLDIVALVSLILSNDQ
ncbi:dockerin type I repeat-containing protein, partial [Candidatus Marinimicrobia bacterium]|nr:dockerin type I repeat-containing protein [Candidatus Neomarinimicrobiota bacterium]